MSNNDIYYFMEMFFTLCCHDVNEGLFILTPQLESKITVSSPYGRCIDHMYCLVLLYFLRIAINSHPNKNLIL